MNLSFLTALALAGATLIHAPAATAEPLPGAETREAIISRLAGEMQRLDGEALYVRQSRRESWENTVEGLAREAKTASSLANFGRAAALLDYAYPNLHARVSFGPELMGALVRHFYVPAVTFEAEWLSLNETAFRISEVPETLAFSSALRRPARGDRLTAINGISMEELSWRNFELCKYPLREQCDQLLQERLIGRLFPLTDRQKLVYTLEREGALWDVDVPIAREAPPLGSRNDLNCANEPHRYDGFELSYAGKRACVYLSNRHPGAAVLRITSFQYRDVSDLDPIRSLPEEVDALYPWWKQHSGTFDHLVIDLADNRGGNAPFPYYGLLVHEPFQEQYVSFRKTPELLNERLRRGIFWGSRGQEAWFRRLLTGGVWASTPWGEFLPHVPMFCPSEEAPCDEGAFTPREHEFHGKVSVLLNQDCVSSCDGFAYEIQDSFGDRARFFGHPQAADTAYARLTLHVLLDEDSNDGFRILTRPIRTEISPPPFFSQTIAVSRSVTKEGKVVSGHPIELDGFIPKPFGQSRSEWLQRALSAALATGGGR